MTEHTDSTDTPRSDPSTVATGGDAALSGRRWLAIGVVGVLCLLGAAGAIVFAKSRATTSLAERERAALEELDMLASVDDPPPSTTPVSVKPARPIEPGLVEPGAVVFLNRVPGDDYGRLTTIDDSGERRFFGDQRCDRAHVSAGLALCLAPVEDGLFDSWRALVIDFTDEALPVIVDQSSALPSRARVDPRGEIVAWTGFVTGHSYLDVGEFATQTNYIDFSRGEGKFTATEFQARTNADRFGAQDGNWWGVTFDPTVVDQSYLTYGSGGDVEIVRADVRNLDYRPFIEDASCPSLSPDGSLMVFKREVKGGAATMSLVVHDMATDEDRVLSERAFVDDQVEWLDDRTILYGLPRAESVGEPQPGFDLWKLDVVDPQAEPELFQPFADSPAVYRDTRG